jgi:DNA sulfur modification protein DndD
MRFWNQYQGIKMIKNEILRFLQTLKAEDVSSEVRKIANLVVDHLGEIHPLGTSQGRRAKKIAELATNNWKELSDVIKDITNDADETNETIKKLKSIKVGPFRGFAKEETLDLSSSLVLIYGPNGTGKSSFCEALEYGLLGSVEEAQSKRFSIQTNYLKNAHVNRFVPPVIEGINSTNKEILVSPNEALYRFCFVEKNRIDNFSRIAAHAPAKQTELISSLFGLDSFYDFVKNFSREIDDRHIDLIGKNGLQLKEKQQELEVHKLTIEGNKQSLLTQTDIETELALQFRSGITFDQLVVALGTDESPGEIQILEVELRHKQPPLTGLTVKSLEASKVKVESTHQKLTNKLAELTEASEGLSFKQLYCALLDLQEVSEDKCPACKTPLAQVAQNPYELAKAELAKLGHLAQLEQDRDLLKIGLTKAIKSVYIMVQTCVEQIGIDIEVNSLKLRLLEDEEKLDWVWWKALEPGSKDMASSWFLLIDQVQKLELRDVEVKKANEEREAKEARLAELRKSKEEVIKLQEKRKTLNEGAQKAKAIIDAFNEENKGLIESVETEKAIIQTNLDIASNYSDFVNLLIDYKEALPSKLVADLGDLVVTLYNAFNRNDTPNDLLAAIKLPLTSGQHIEISYQGEPETYFDALHILSEGHIRCIGLAILLAKNLKTNSPLLIFDDPVNAIDDEHRSSIRETLFKDDHFKEKQIILACHGEEFFKNIHQTIGKAAASESESYIFSAQMGENHVQVNSMRRAKNYVLAAVELFEQTEHRDSLMSSRRALEHLCEKAWFHYGKHCDKSDSLISVSRRSPHLPWDLRALVENLKSKIHRSKADIPNSEGIVSAFETLLGENGQDPHWLYLNKGTHEESDRDEFDHAVVGEIVTSLVQLDEALS